ncbi:hypothetical protein ACRAWD_18475 [Caulobacter segnis]
MVKDNTNDISAGFKWSNEHWLVTGDLQYVYSHRGSTDLTVYNTVTSNGGFGLDLTGALPKITMANVTNTPSAFNLYAAMDHIDDNDAREYSGQVRRDLCVRRRQVHQGHQAGRSGHLARRPPRATRPITGT